MRYDMHGLVRIDVENTAPTLAQLDIMFAPFRVGRDAVVGPADIVVSATAPPPVAASHGDMELRFDEHTTVELATGVTVSRRGDTFHLAGTRELLTFVLPIIDIVAVSHGAGMIHAATFQKDGRGVNMPAWGGVGKTSTVAKMLRLPGVGFMGDDWAFLSQDQELFAYHKPMFIKPHHRPIYPHLFAGKKKPLVPVRLSRPIGKVTSAIHPMITKYPQLAGLTRRWSPEHMMVSPDRAFPDALMSQRAPLAINVFVERFDGPDVEMTAVSEGWMVSRMIGNFFIEMHQSSRELLAALAATNLVPLEQFLEDKRAVLARAIAGRPTHLLRVPASWSPDQASDAIVTHLMRTLDAAGAAA